MGVLTHAFQGLMRKPCVGIYTYFRECCKDKNLWLGSQVCKKEPSYAFENRTEFPFTRLCF